MYFFGIKAISSIFHLKKRKIKTEDEIIERSANAFYVGMLLAIVVVLCWALVFFLMRFKYFVAQ
ncbi:MAG: hypothetical protein CO073_00195 [Candidatus Komeilibacteria bacterium CG_4_9_14_0_8_um_filter_36_9]|uniref:Uncharacterized protein n=1 Tax=Candidatus Komeilibacteria bacterium CG_4_9_14_0_8_um_filter_36_9 TaxID=1974473 RepID=A0A2M8DSG7_9BACT|nr:MAG: hypothetical protein CO073_00195 [Candidatus Komeilibacteria bacterium CG_4_9_14_0_8_um_filter_36_9]